MDHFLMRHKAGIEGTDESQQKMMSTYDEENLPGLGSTYPDESNQPDDPPAEKGTNRPQNEYLPDHFRTTPYVFTDFPNGISVQTEADENRYDSANGHGEGILTQRILAERAAEINQEKEETNVTDRFTDAQDECIFENEPFSAHGTSMSL
jgi:hypothetical protein